MAQRHAHGMRAIDRAAGRSGLRGWNGGYKTVLAVGTLVLCLAVDRPQVSAAVVCVLAALQAVKGGLPLHHYLHLLRVPLGFLVLGGIAVACDAAAVPVGDWNLPLFGGYLCVRADSLRFAGELVLKALGAVSALYLLALTTTAGELVGVLRRAHVPTLLCELMYLIYRFVFVLSDTYGRMRDAAGARLGWRDFAAACRTFGGVAGNLLVMALRRARVYEDAMAARGYDGVLPFYQEEKPVRAAHIAGLALFWAALLALSVL